MSSKCCEVHFCTFATSVLGFDICVVCTRPKSCFGGVIKQSGYLVQADKIFLGFTAMFCTYYVIDVHTGKVLSVVVANKRQAKMDYFIVFFFVFGYGMD